MTNEDLLNSMQFAISQLATTSLSLVHQPAEAVEGDVTFQINAPGGGPSRRISIFADGTVIIAPESSDDKFALGSTHWYNSVSPEGLRIQGKPHNLGQRTCHHCRGTGKL
ncbi:hypothetical protein H6CHR_03648 [Variovorax sp. PBL-H6]|uniref:hypothetical protein n=1 Tax=Variovorax sp. PBL-H6 TaxID=434009 RepID=UPI0013195468|nr:hypothetical protein [Variovorax sp. PBL-H6]VTU31677.1 hypothetical protein H6CHR_03648 [Variovorax sp. PBL-H6]